MKNVFMVMVCVGIAATIMNPKPIIEINIYKGKEKNN